MKPNVAILIFDEVEVLDFTGPFDVFAVTDELRAHEAYRVSTVAAREDVGRARHGLRVIARYMEYRWP